MSGGCAVPGGARHIIMSDFLTTIRHVFSGAKRGLAIVSLAALLAAGCAGDEEFSAGSDGDRSTAKFNSKLNSVIRVLSVLL